jgi:hypothetical protein
MWRWEHTNLYHKTLYFSSTPYAPNVFLFVIGNASEETFRFFPSVQLPFPFLFLFYLHIHFFISIMILNLIFSLTRNSNKIYFVYTLLSLTSRTTFTLLTQSLLRKSNSLIYIEVMMKDNQSLEGDEKSQRVKVHTCALIIMNRMKNAEEKGTTAELFLLSLFLLLLSFSLLLAREKTI